MEHAAQCVPGKRKLARHAWLKAVAQRDDPHAWVAAAQLVLQHAEVQRRRAVLPAEEHDLSVDCWEQLEERVDSGQQLAPYVQYESLQCLAWSSLGGRLNSLRQGSTS